MVNLLFGKSDNFGLISGRIWQVPLCSSHIDLHTGIRSYLHTDVHHVNRSELDLEFNPTPPIFVSGLPSICPRYDHSMYISTTSMYPLAVSFDVNRPIVIMTQTDVAQSFLMTPHQLRRHMVHADVALPSSPCISDRHQDDTKEACIPPRRHLDTSPGTT